MKIIKQKQHTQYHDKICMYNQIKTLILAIEIFYQEEIWKKILYLSLNIFLPELWLDSLTPETRKSSCIPVFFIFFYLCCYCGQSVLWWYNILSELSVMSLWLQNIQNVTNRMMCLIFPENHGTNKSGLFYILTILKSFLIEIRLTAGGGEEIEFSERINSKSLSLKLGL